MLYAQTVRRVAVIAVAAAFVAAPAAAAPPQGGTFEPGTRLGGLRLGATTAQVERRWGKRHGICRNCRHPTWYFNYEPFTPQGVGVEFRRGRAVALFTMWSPPEWRTRGGLAIGDPAADVRAQHPRVRRRDCRGYRALWTRAGNTLSIFYISEQKLWGFGLSRPGVPVCR